MLKRGRSILVFLFAILACTLVCWRVAEAGKAGKPPPPPPPTYEYSLTQLKVLQGFTTSSGIDVNDNGRVAGNLKTASGGQYAAVWETPSATPTVLPLPEGYDQSQANAINNRGQIVGWVGLNHPYTIRPAIWVPGPGGYEVQDLIGAADQGYATDINENGWVVGYFANENSQEAAFVICPADADEDGVPDTWFLDDDSDGINDLMFGLRGFSDQGWFTVEAYAINDSGWVVGLWDRGWDYSGWYPLLIIPDYTLPNPWFADDDGDGTNDLAITLPVGMEAIDVNNQGQIAIYGPVVLQTEVAEDDTVTFTQTWLPPTSTYGWYLAGSINDNGQVAGMGGLLKQGKGKADDDPLLWQADKGTRLLESLSNMAGFSDLSAATSINIHGQVVGSGTTSAGVRGYVATPVPK